MGLAEETFKASNKGIFIFDSIIKRDGRKVPFDPDKISRVTLWD